jgi:hypothetical protein
MVFFSSAIHIPIISVYNLLLYFRFIDMESAADDPAFKIKFYTQPQIIPHEHFRSNRS